MLLSYILFITSSVKVKRNSPPPPKHVHVHVLGCVCVVFIITIVYMITTIYCEVVIIYNIYNCLRGMPKDAKYLYVDPSQLSIRS